MKKYKLINIYPRSPKLGTIMEFGKGWGDTEQWIIDYPEEAKEFWEPVVEKEFEILEFKDDKDNIFKYVGQSPLSDRNAYEWVDYPGYFVDNLPEKITITKIRRISDGVEFKIGDLCYPKSMPLNCGKITSFEFCKVGYFRISSESKYYIGINDVVKTEEPLFTTEDGYKIFNETDLLWDTSDNTPTYLDTTSASWFNTFVYCNNPKAKDRKAWKYRVNAEKYISENKPVYSKNQIDSAISKCYISTSVGTFLKEDDFKQHLNLKL